MISICFSSGIPSIVKSAHIREVVGGGDRPFVFTFWKQNGGESSYGHWDRESAGVAASSYSDFNGAGAYEQTLAELDFDTFAITRDTIKRWFLAASPAGAKEVNIFFREDIEALRRGDTPEVIAYSGSADAVYQRVVDARGETWRVIAKRS